jgi:cell division protein FtsI (penicillin-binding protein 3)
MSGTEQPAEYSNRRGLLLGLYFLAMSALVWRVIDLQVLNNEFLQEHGNARALRVVEIPAHRGIITDRNGEPLAVSTPVKSVWATPRKVLSSGQDLAQLASYMNIPLLELSGMMEERIGREFVYLKRHVEPALAEQIMALGIPGVSVEQEFKRYYPAGEVAAHIVGFTNIDDIGQEGLELAYDKWLRGTPGSKRVIKDRLGRVIEDVESIKTPSQGKLLQLSVDRRIQYLAYRELKSAVNVYGARGGSLVMLDVRTGEILAMVGQPSHNPNNRSEMRTELFRNRAVTDVFEPGSTIKPFTIVAALQSGIYSPKSVINTAPGYFRVGNHTISDHRNYGSIDIPTIIQKSSNVGASKIALSLEPEMVRSALAHVGLGMPTGSGFPGESAGYLGPGPYWSDIELATIAFGYGISVTALQLAQAYLVLAADGMLLPPTFIKQEFPVKGKQVIPARIAREVRHMLETVVSNDGTGIQAAVKGYRVAGKTGTVHKAVEGGYSEDKYISLFAGMAPVSDPRFVIIVSIDEPRGEKYYGGQIAAPIFSSVMQGALRLMDVPPDDLRQSQEAPIVAGTRGAQ